jgi:hypothetical protein
MCTIKIIYKILKFVTLEGFLVIQIVRFDMPHCKIYNKTSCEVLPKIDASLAFHHPLSQLFLLGPILGCTLLFI